MRSRPAIMGVVAILTLLYNIATNINPPLDSLLLVITFVLGAATVYDIMDGGLTD